MGKSTILMAIFNSYVKLPEAILGLNDVKCSLISRFVDCVPLSQLFFGGLYIYIYTHVYAYVCIYTYTDQIIYRNCICVCGFGT